MFSRRRGRPYAAAKVLADAGKPMNCKAIVETMLAKGKDARFRKVERGKFEATDAARQ